jgi:hypothetical protein
MGAFLKLPVLKKIEGVKKGLASGYFLAEAE